MTLNFPNASRHYNASSGCVRFKGYDAVFEITFDLDAEALLKFDPDAATDEASLLRVFDSNRGLIEHVAQVQYRRSRESVCRLTPGNFRTH